MKLIEAWLPYPIDFTRGIEQFKVETNPRYTPRDLNKDGKQDTFCNIFLWDVTRLYKCEIPHWVSPEGGVAPVGKGRELSANGIEQWMHAYGADWGWSSATEPEARMHARHGRCAVALWANHTGIGHVAVVVPAPKEMPLVTHIAQAGATNFSCKPLKKGFGNIRPGFWFHP